jgi:hypothetical protein
MHEKDAIRLTSMIGWRKGSILRKVEIRTLFANKPLFGPVLPRVTLKIGRLYAVRHETLAMPR